MKKIIITLLMLTLIIICLVVAVLMNAEKIIKYHIRPLHHFDINRVPVAPDYGSEQAWAALPGKSREAGLVPPGVGRDNQNAAPVDVFYIHPTGYFGDDNWNSPIDPDLPVFENVRGMLATQASVFNGCGRIYAPQYREATLYSFLDKERDGQKALDFAYGDVVRAFEYYLRHYNRGRPFIIVSHSQGSLHALRLIEEKIDSTELYGSFIAGYVIGYKIPVEKFSRSLKRVRPCEGTRDTGCIISWNTLEEGKRPRDIGIIWYAGGWEQVGNKKILCVNPLTWTSAEGVAPRELHRGAIFTSMKGFYKSQITGRASGRVIDSLPVPVERLVTARCTPEGFLYVPKVGKIFDPGGRGIYHVHDYHLFYVNIRENAMERVAEFMKRQGR